MYARDTSNAMQVAWHTVLSHFISFCIHPSEGIGPTVGAAAGGVVGEIRETSLPGGLPPALPSVLIGTTRLTVGQIRLFNQSRPMTYKLLENDCRSVQLTCDHASSIGTIFRQFDGLFQSALFLLSHSGEPILTMFLSPCLQRHYANSLVKHLTGMEGSTAYFLRQQVPEAFSTSPRFILALGLLMPVYPPNQKGLFIILMMMLLMM